MNKNVLAYRSLCWQGVLRRMAGGVEVLGGPTNSCRAGAAG